MATPLEVLATARYVQLTTFRRDGRPVPTPVWCARRGADIVIWTGPEAGKVKRIRRDPRVSIAPCTARGRPLGRDIDARARILDPAEVDDVFAALGRKYGWQFRLTTLGRTLGRLIGRTPDAAALAVRL